MEESDKERFLDIIRQVLEYPDDVSEEQTLEELGIHSMNFIQIIVGIEKEWGIETDDNTLDFNRFPRVIDLIENFAPLLAAEWRLASGKD